MIVAIPGFLWNATNYMTDGPALSAQLVCLALGARSLRARGCGWLLASLGAGVFAFSIREFSLAAPVAVLATHLVSPQTRESRRKVLAWGAGTLAICGGVYIWSQHLPGMMHVAFGAVGLHSVEVVMQLYFTATLFLAPATAFAALRMRRLFALHRLVVGAVIGLIGTVLFVHLHGILIGNYMSQSGFMGNAVLDGDRAAVVPALVWHLFEIAAVAAGALLGMVVTPESCRGGRIKSLLGADEPAATLLAVFVLFFSLGLALYGLAFNAFDRYTWPGVAVGAVLLVRRGLPTRRDADSVPQRVVRRIAPVALLAAGAVLALVQTINADSYGAARWQAGDLAVRAGVPARYVDAGFEWVGWNARLPVVPGMAEPSPSYRAWYTQMVPGFRDCALVSNSPLISPDLSRITGPSDFSGV